jgi:hypothetical protein
VNNLCKKETGKSHVIMHILFGIEIENVSTGKTRKEKKILN